MIREPPQKTTIRSRINFETSDQKIMNSLHELIWKIIYKIIVDRWRMKQTKSTLFGAIFVHFQKFVWL